MNCYQHFTIEERTCLRKYNMEGLSFRKIAKLSGRSPAQSRARLQETIQIDTNTTPSTLFRENIEYPSVKIVYKYEDGRNDRLFCEKKL